jgi:hypothetical protein
MVHPTDQAEFARLVHVSALPAGGLWALPEGVAVKVDIQQGQAPQAASLRPRQARGPAMTRRCRPPPRAGRRDRRAPPALAPRRPEPASGAACRGGGRKGRWAGC